MQLNVTQLLGELKQAKKEYDAAVRLLSDLASLDQAREDNVFALRTRLSKLEKVSERLGEHAGVGSALSAWTRDYRQELAASAELARRQFGVELESALHERGRSLSGQYPKLSSGWFTIELDFDAWQATLFFGPKQERLDQFPLSVSGVVQHIERADQRLGCGLTEPDFLAALYQAYEVVSRRLVREDAPIIAVQAELASMLELRRPSAPAGPKEPKDYTRADLSYDLFRIRRAGVLDVRSRKLRLVVAIRAYTNRRKDFLWVPDDERGGGTAYSHVQFKEVAQ
jgi:hypothetical protein